MPKCVSTSSIAADPSTSQVPSARDTNSPIASLASAGRSPTIAVSRSVTVTSPSTAPYSSITSAVCLCDWRNDSSSCTAGIESGTNSASLVSLRRSIRTPLNASGSRSADRTIPTTSSRPPWQTTNCVCEWEARNSRSSSSDASTSIHSMSGRGVMIAATR